VFRDESAHMAFAFEVIRTVRARRTRPVRCEMKAQVVQMMSEAVDCEVASSPKTP
jgi:ribonucleoside-diphosphate reductase beta chain